MEQRGIHVVGAGSSAVNVDLMIIDPTASYNGRAWSDIAKTIKLSYIKDKGWVFTSYEGGVLFYSEKTPISTQLVDPWSIQFAINTGDTGIGAAPSLTPYDDPNIQITVGTPVTETDPNTGDKVTKTTTTYYNAVTNDRFAYTDTVREKMAYVSTPVTRYDTINLALGKVYRFSFVKDFENLGYTNDKNDPNYSVVRGIYRVDKIMSYKDVLAQGIDVYNNLYIPSSVPKDVYLKDEPTFQNTMFYKLVDPRNEDVTIYMPLSFVEGTPNGSVERYDKLILGIDIGVFSNTDMLVDMVDIITQLLEARWGVSARAEGSPFPADKDLVTLQRYDDVYLTTEDYQVLDDNRAVIKQNSTNTLLDDLFSSEMNKLREENVNLKTKVQSYESIITKQG